MARARNIKPKFFKNYDLADLGPLCQILFAGLWCLADKEGRLEDKPRFIKAEVFPYYDCDVNGELTKLERLNFVRRYKCNGEGFIEVINFKKHQSPHGTEKASTLPRYEDRDIVSDCINGEHVNNGSVTVDSRNNNGGNSPDSLIPDSLIYGFSDSPIPDSPIAEEKPLRAEKRPAAKPKDEALQTVCRQTWEAYATAYFNKYGAEPIRNAKVNTHVQHFVKRIGYDNAPALAAWFLTHTGAFYTAQLHSWGLLEKDCEKLHTEWSTGMRMTGQKAKETERRGSMMDSVNEIMAKRGLV